MGTSQQLQRGILAGSLFLIGLLPAAQAANPPMVSQVVSMKSVGVDEFSEVLQGNDPAVQWFGLPFVVGDLVQILLTSDGATHPPLANGQPDARDTLLATTRIGQGVSPKPGSPGRFSTAVTPRPGGGAQIYVRVFNASELGAASFYSDSQLFTVSSTYSELFVPVFSNGMVAVDHDDTDGDGLNNSWEASYQSDPGETDSDGDGMTDGEEEIAGTGITEEESFFGVADITRISADTLRVSWASELNRTYTLQCLTLDDATPPETLAELNGTGQEQEKLVSVADKPCAIFRLLVKKTPPAE
jgi:hypothetical protein